MQNGMIKSILAYYAEIPEMRRILKRERDNLEKDYNGLMRETAMDGMPHGQTVGDQTARLAECAIENGTKTRMQEIEVKLCVLEADAQAIRGCLDVLHGKYKRLIFMRDLHDYSWARISAEMDMPYSTVRRWYDKAVGRLGGLLDDLPMVDELEQRASRAHL